jgi:hypothetical protein
MAAHHIDFWFTMGSTYSYLSVSRLANVERSTGVTFRWRPFHLLILQARYDLAGAPQCEGNRVPKVDIHGLVLNDAFSCSPDGADRTQPKRRCPDRYDSSSPQIVRGSHCSDS